ncbi:MAG: 5'-methylthioadenosine/S-adenosylhomocysteine nucleosidase [Actinomycetaceae bacterium]|nr:5'-methylthioadenosine/S-adenosylhomocysteine nucleosidase [Actinomycetaceae bacterium]
MESDTIMRLFAIITAAQDEEIEPLVQTLATRSIRPIKQKVSNIESWLATSTRGNILIVKTGIGLTSAATALTAILTKYKPQFVISIGSAGGLNGVTIGDIVASKQSAYADANSTSIGYEYGQIPDQPAKFEGSQLLLDACPPEVKKGLCVSTNSFVTDEKAKEILSHFPQALSVEMESTALAQVCHMFDVPYLMVRCISDMCNNDEYNEHLNDASQRATEAAMSIISTLETPRIYKAPQRFSSHSISASILLTFALSKNLDVSPISDETEKLRTYLHEELPDDIDDNTITTYLGLIESAKKKIHEGNYTLSANTYDRIRKEILSKIGAETKQGTFAWPPTSQTIIKRANGFWNDALKNVGLSQRSGRSRGGLHFTEADYINALRSFAKWCAKNTKKPSYKLYSDWISATKQQGSVPSGAAVRQHFGSWHEATKQTQI